MERETLKQVFWDRLFFYPTDAHYIQALASNLELKKGEEYRLFSVMGAQELSNTLPLATYRNFQAFRPNDPLFRFNLHLHTEASDGAFKVKELLEQAAAYADIIAPLVKKDGMPPLTIAVTDHDCMDSLIPVLKELTRHYEKYQNLRIVLGIEMGAVWKEQTMQRVPMEYELMFYGVNPFDVSIQDFLQSHQEKRNAARDEIIHRLSERYPFFGISKEDAFAQDPLLLKNQGLGYAERLTKYAISKVADTTQNEEIKRICHSLNGNKTAGLVCYAQCLYAFCATAGLAVVCNFASFAVSFLTHNHYGLCLWVIYADHADNLVIATVKFHSAHTCRNATHGAHLALVETDGPSVTVCHYYLVVAVCQPNSHHAVVIKNVYGYDSICSWAAVGFKAGLLDYSVLCGKYNIM